MHIFVFTKYIIKEIFQLLQNNMLCDFFFFLYAYNKDILKRKINIFTKIKFLVFFYPINNNFSALYMCPILSLTT